MVALFRINIFASIIPNSSRYAIAFQSFTYYVFIAVYDRQPPVIDWWPETTGCHRFVTTEKRGATIGWLTAARAAILTAAT
jgi:hypothetical protein